MTNKIKSRVTGSLADTLWPYAAFIISVAVYSYFTLGHGFNATDEGYLLALGGRVADGEIPYKDFYFFRTPLSVYFQAALIGIFGEGYTILCSRIVWTIQMCLTVILISFLYRKLVRPWEVFLLLVTTFTVSTLLLIFPWYSYDALSFAVLTVVLIQHRQFELAGLAAFLSFMCKQNYAVVLPAFFIIAIVMQRMWPRLKIISAKEILRIIVGAVIPLAAYMVYLHWSGTFGAFWDNVFVYPRMASQVSIWFVLFQNHHEVFYIGIPAVIAGVCWFHARPGRIIFPAIATVASIVVLVLIFRIHHNFIYSLVYFNLGLLFVALARFAINKAARESTTGRKLLVPLLLGAIIQYAAGFNYAGVVLSYMGSGLLLAVLYVIFRNAGPGGNARLVAVGLLVVFLAGGAYHKYNYVYRDVGRGEKTVEFKTAKLAGITSGTRNVRQIDGLVDAAKEYSEPGDFILMFPDMPVMYYLADRKNPTPVGWYVQLEYGNWLMDRILMSLQNSPPKLILVQRFFEIDFERSGALIDYRGIPRYIPIASYINDHYNLEGSVGDVYMFLPKE